MALSNWDTAALNHKGEPINGIFTSPMGVTVEIYKNWLYVRDKKAWAEGGSFVEPTIMHVTSGDFIYKDVHLVAIRGPQEGVFAVVWSWDKERKNVLGMVGCGVYGFTDEGEWVGVTKDSLRWFQNRLQEKTAHEFIVVSYRHGEDGVEHSERTRHEVESCVLDVPECFREVDLVEKALRFNQGDAYFATRLGTDVDASPPGKAEEPLLMTMTKHTKKKKRKKT